MPTNVASARPRVLIVTKRLDRGGAEQHICLISPALIAKGIDIEIFLLERGGVLEDVAMRKGVPIFGMLRTKGGLVHVAGATVALAAHIRKRRPDAIHFFLPEPYLIGSVAAMVARLHVRIMSRRSLDHYQRNHPMLAFVERWLHRSTAVLLGNSRAVVGQLELEAGRSDKIGLIHNGVVLPNLPDPAERKKARVTLGLTEPMFVIAIVANVLLYKGYEDLLEALVLIAPALSNPWKLLAVGRDEGLGEKLRAYAATHGISDRVSWLGERDDVPCILAAADTFVLPSHQEGLSNALIEAMANGLPVIATAVGGNLDAIVDGDSGRLVAVQSPRALAAAICEVANDAELRQRLGAAARLRAERMFSLKACVASYENLYGNLALIGRKPVQSIIDGGVPARAAGAA